VGGKTKAIRGDNGGTLKAVFSLNLSRKVHKEIMLINFQGSRFYGPEKGGQNISEYGKKGKSAGNLS